jgi:YfiH family protein
VAVLVADCVPIALAGAGVAAAIHAGWRGICAGVIEAAVETADPGGSAGGLSAWIGPCIGPCCFEVGPEVPEQFAAGHPWAPDCSVRVAGSLHFDLRMASAAVLEDRGVAVAGGLDVPCTRCDPRFFSHRRDGTPHRQALVTWVGGGR